jgi:methylisocitrate lyase
VVGTINAYSALLAERAGFKAIYLSGAGVANASYGMPDLGVTSLQDVLIDVNRITSACDLPLLVDIDTGWGTAVGIERTAREMIKAGAAAVHMEDQVAAKRCGHRPNKALVSTEEMCDRVAAASSGRTDPTFVIMARTDAAASEGLDSAIERANRYVSAGADMIFAEALRSADDFRTFIDQVKVPVLANMTEFGKTPLMTTSELSDLGISIALYPLSAFRAMSRATEQVYAALKADGIQTGVLDLMQPRDELYDVLGYLEIEQRIDKLLQHEK